MIKEPSGRDAHQRSGPHLWNLVVITPRMQRTRSVSAMEQRILSSDPHSAVRDADSSVQTFRLRKI